ncbi:phenylalanine--tRNA ligase subunit alpha [candidate division WOR-1 bacterium RIFOXYA12_FULL_43_27]|uniref:Phenylalanine--tRNA ligase alpha subunit n=1 Tax=candidate division WOR-1 bacterium RIFOXYC2_FULL_46_14 TaxID=1802587 RepID=A0A1F4U3K5_UNCSA|nr:MAG: phenylalanine--tRNA ligase subunit alpha [candidate division WOR-1 bacterium RIFOXYA12_FULL_43_27]OGC20108.1 MAG: phenylalanine--tRNA ligase subunit alpha [candidate division WOR-1 bacterium RIFOXYB2_FULL_46_45]OGC32155.1 MAG: phenylalanine--tRNA ligase subunit alpha [candidate division WOR-1 bacterium RIFOXYA2_FULL_46_56]OGC39555.1 MAG: phenylalanine--tRNA ligase subunit alpha [candidate division WOR-1 bacterium RIFOXYC2_FULL_46_14]
MAERIQAIENQAIVQLTEVKNLLELENFRVHYMGKKGLITELLQHLKDLTPEERPVFGKNLNIAKRRIEDMIAEKKTLFENLETEKKIKTDAIDVTLPGRGYARGKLHPITQVMEEVKEIFLRLGFIVESGPDIETDYYNFEALNIPKHHASRDMWSTLYVGEETLLRTHTSPVQIRVMEKKKPPLAVIAPGRVFRRDADPTHSTVFHQIEGFAVDKNITFANLKGVITAFLHAVFGKEKKVRFRPSYFPFTEPSAEVDVEWGDGWLEILGCGMIDPNVFKAVDYDPEVWSGYAFGMGIERIAMLKFGIKDIRLFFENDMRFLKQF